MKARWAKWAARLYPFAWQRRYGAEFDALIEDGGGGWRETADVLKGAIVMHVRSSKTVRLIAACGLVGMGIASMAVWVMSHRYVSTAVLRCYAELFLPYAHGTPPRFVAEALSRKNLEEVMAQYDLYGEERRAGRTDYAVDTMRRNIFIAPIGKGGRGGSQVFRLSYASEVPRRAQQVTKTLVAQLMDANLRAKDGGALGVLEVIDPPNAPQRAVPKLPALAGVGLFGGALLGLIVAVVIRLAMLAAAGYRDERSIP
jgi:hypothetical protein